MIRTETTSGFPILAIAPSSLNPKDVPGHFIVADVHDPDDEGRYVVWWMKDEDGSCYYGDYHDSLSDALRAFTVRVDRDRRFDP